jgi:curved DNA-binding protein CbpA
MPSARGPSHWGDAIPRSREDALQVLGIGVTPDASETALKKIVDGLRLSWHPDYAKDADDLRLRELRLKQINAAWEIIAGKRVDA